MILKQVQIIYRATPTASLSKKFIEVDADNIKEDAIQYCEDRGWQLSFINY